MRKHFVKIPVTLETMLTREELCGRIDAEIEAVRKLQLYKYRSQPMWFWKRSESAVELMYCESYKTDMCDIMFKGEIKDGLSGCQLDGFIKKPKGIWAIVNSICVFAAVLTVGLPVILSQSPDIPLYNAAPLMIFLLPVAYIIAQLLMFETKRLAAMNERLRTLTLAQNTDVLGEELEDEKEDGEHDERG